MSTGPGDPRIFADGSAAEGADDGALTDGATLLRSATGLGGPVARSHQPVTVPARKQPNMAAIGNERRGTFFFKPQTPFTGMSQVSPVSRARPAAQRPNLSAGRNRGIPSLRYVPVPVSREARSVRGRDRSRQRQRGCWGRP
jgi:hypothetical protein